MTKRKELLKTINKHAKTLGLTLIIEEGGNHTKLWLGDRYTTIPRHNEIDNRLADKIYKQIGMK